VDEVGVIHQRAAAGRDDCFSRLAVAELTIGMAT
jgi:hypothetical protein